MAATQRKLVSWQRQVKSILDDTTRAKEIFKATEEVLKEGEKKSSSLSVVRGQTRPPRKQRGLPAGNEEGQLHSTELEPTRPPISIDYTQRLKFLPETKPGHSAKPEDVLVFDKWFGGDVVDSVVNVETDPREEEENEGYAFGTLPVPPSPPAGRMSASDAAAIFLSPYLSKDISAADGDINAMAARPPGKTSPPSSISPPSYAPRLSLDDVIAGKEETLPLPSEERECRAGEDTGKYDETAAGGVVPADPAADPAELQNSSEQEQQRRLEAEREFLQRENIVLKAMVKKLRIRVYDLEKSIREKPQGKGRWTPEEEGAQNSDRSFGKAPSSPSPSSKTRTTLSSSGRFITKPYFLLGAEEDEEEGH